MQVPTPDNLGLNAEAVSDALRQLLRKGQIVLAGPPGTGKTKLAQELAAHLCDRDPARWRLIQLHPSYSYEDFISGLGPRGGGTAGFLVQPGHLLRILLEAQLQPGKDFCLVIDEFNRAKLATVLGELLTMLGGSRSTAAPVRIRDAPAFQEMTEMRWPIPGYGLPNEAAQWSSLASPIHMPPNLYLICTMNTADRSIAALDAALQRRFGMIQMVPSLLSPRAEVPNPEQPLLLPYSDSDSVLMQRCRLPSGERQALGAALDAINAKLDAMCFEPGERIGHSYFLSSDCRSRHDVRAAWREGVIPYLESVMQDRSQDLIRVIEREHSILADPILAGGAAAPEPSAEVLKQAERLARALTVPGEVPSDVSNALEGWLSQLHGSKTHALLFAGPPGCGKTFTAEALAKVLVDEDSERWETITFSPSYSYEEFMVGVRPDPSQPGKYKLQKGVLLEMAARCTPADGPRRRCVLVIDEFNRAKLPQVMGECLNMLEYRGRKVDLRDNTQESLPDELYVIAMMNNADRSIEPLDSALRRRFATVTFDVTKEPFRSIAAGALQSRFKDLSNVAKRMRTFLDAAHSVLRADEQIGVCFFCDAAEKLKACTRLADKRTKLVRVLKQVWAAEVRPYVALHCDGERLNAVTNAWTEMVDGISGDASLDEAAEAAAAEAAVTAAEAAKAAAAKDLQNASVEQKKDREIVLAAVRQTGCALKYASEELRNDREVVLAAVRQDGLALEHASEGLRKERKYVLAAVEKNGWALQFAGEELRNNTEVVRMAVKQSGRALLWASEKLQRNFAFVLALVKEDRHVLGYTIALEVESWLGLEPPQGRWKNGWTEGKKLGTVKKSEVQDLCRRAGIPYEHLPVKMLLERICEKLEDLQDAD